MMIAGGMRGAVATLRPFRVAAALRWGNMAAQGSKIIARILHGGLQTAATGDIRLHRPIDRRGSVSAVQVAFWLVFEVPPAGFEPATHGLGRM